jgi:hypothetical protein|tara:strand:- start:174 stop:527 length:354 start_codon:yes stop_codon:yes gene_type:complete
MPKYHNFKDRYKNDTSNRIQLTVSKEIAGVDTVIDLTGSSILMQLKKGEASTVSIKTFEIGTGITLTDAVNGVFSIDEFIVSLGVYNYFYDIQITFASGVIKTYLKGRFNVTQDTSQ